MIFRQKVIKVLECVKGGKVSEKIQSKSSSTRMVETHDAKFSIF